MAQELSYLRRSRRPGNIAEVRRAQLCKGKRFNSSGVSSMRAASARMRARLRFCTSKLVGANNRRQRAGVV
jgi:hypothetical protein